MKDYKLLTECIFCEQSFADVYRTKEHIIPKSRIGHNHLQNYTASCVWCNELKQDRDSREFALYVGQLILDGDEKYDYIKPFLSKMRTNAWKLYNKTHKTHKDYHGFFGFTPPPVKVIAIPVKKAKKKKIPKNTLMNCCKNSEQLLNKLNYGTH